MIRAGVSDLATGHAGLTNHDGQTDGHGAALEEDVALDLEAELLVVGVVGLRAGLEVDRAVLGVRLFLRLPLPGRNSPPNFRVSLFACLLGGWVRY
jgi:hypothetical protein